MTDHTAAAADLRVGEPDVAGPLAVFPVFGPVPTLEYRSFAEAVAVGAAIRELDPPSVNDVIVDNPLDVAILLYEGEEIQGAQQDRTLDVSVLVAAGSRQQVPVSCVEAGRWDGSRRTEGFTPAPQAAYPERTFLHAALRAPGHTSETVGLGRASRFATGAVEGARLEHEGELAALTAFPGEAPRTRIRRPSRRQP